MLIQQLVTFRHVGNKANVLSNTNLANRAYKAAIMFYLSDFYCRKWGLDNEERIQKNQRIKEKNNKWRKTGAGAEKRWLKEKNVLQGYKIKVR